MKIIEVTTYRIEGPVYRSSGIRTRSSSLSFHIEDDLSRRDFTMNALAMDMKGDVVDPFGGERDIKDR